MFQKVNPGYAKHGWHNQLPVLYWLICMHGIIQKVVYMSLIITHLVNTGTK